MDPSPPGAERQSPSKTQSAQLSAATADHIARSVHARATLAETLHAVLTTAVEVGPGIDAAGVNLYEQNRFEPQAVLGEAPPRLDDLQKRVGAGPCIEASRSQTTIVVADTRADARWLEFGLLARSLGVGAVLCTPLWVDVDRVGSLSLYASEPGSFEDDVLALASLLATQAALAIVSAQRSDNLNTAVDTRDLIGQAKGILMERHRITADAAFAMLTDASQSTRTKLRRVAEYLTTTGELMARRKEL